MKIRVPVISFALMAIVVACNKPSPVAKGASNITSVPAAAADPAPLPSGGAPEKSNGNSAGGETSAPASAAILASFQGRWGLSPQDCTTALGDAKGLLVISGGEVRFTNRGQFPQRMPISPAKSSRAIFTSSARARLGPGSNVSNATRTFWYVPKATQQRVSPMPDVRLIGALAAVFLVLPACHKGEDQDAQDNSMAIDEGVPANQLAGNADIETLPADERVRPRRTSFRTASTIPT